MGFKNPTKAKNLTSAKDIFMAIPDELLGSVVSKALQSGCSIQIGQTRNYATLTVRLYEKGETPVTHYMANETEASALFMELYTYLDALPKV